jgi:two-component system, sensor histidine kinase
MTILARLFLLVTIALVPVTAIQVFDESERRQTRETELNADALRLATLVGMEQDRIIEGARQLLITLSQLRSIRTHDRGACDELFNRVTTQFPTYAHIVAADSQGALICATDRAPRFDALQSAGSPSQSPSTGLAIGDFWAAPDGTQSLQLRVPILDASGNADGVIVAGLRLDALISNVTANILPPKAVLTITDRDGIILAHLPRDGSASTAVGTALPQSRRALIHAQQLGTVEDRDATGRLLVFGYNPVEVPPGDGVYIEVGLDRDSAFAAINRATAWHITALIGALLVGCIMSWLGAHYFIRRPAGDLLRAAGRWRDGYWSARVRARETQSEFGHLGHAFDQMAEAIGEREAQLLKAKNEAETASRVKSSFLANMSHELRTPLNAIIGFSEIITRQVHGPDAGARYRESAAYINASGQHLLRLVNDILDLSKLAAAQVERG